MQFKQVSADEFMKFEAKHPQVTFYQTKYQAEVLSERGAETGFVGVTNDDGTLIAAAMYSQRKLRVGYLFEVTAGPLMDYDDKALVSFFADQMTAYCKAKKGLLLRWLPREFVKQFADDGHVVKQMHENTVPDLKAAGFSYTPVTPVGDDGHFSKISLGYQFIKPLSDLTEETLRKSYRKPVKSALKKAPAYGVKLRQIGYDELGQFQKYTTATAKRRGFKDKPLDFYQKCYKTYGDNIKFIFAELNLPDFIREQQDTIRKIHENIAKEDAALVEYPDSKSHKTKKAQFEKQIAPHEKHIKIAEDLRAQYGDVAVPAGAMFIIQPQEIAYDFSFTNEDFKIFLAPYVIQDHMLTLGVQKHITNYNFYNVTGTFDGHDGVLRFKQGFDGSTFETVGVFERPVRPVLYKCITTLQHVLGRD
ncbi:peptidoglycan bridge formation glycyltransferase FemA/FemB family protein [Furfurilactobacillus rossiae]|uniref:peptidoglycan bridge formation glycyltransferase FemA/FemB family protein n=1 Tax=Furfurilactobacillus rossiae TaxID=231049 RepID=UPI001F46EBAE|nr:peptidoglycan bridge formation glycyltransferase FemA/FemB family protein [Furfurilactobacillus rossiae]MCF6164656.1 aminoacyltransferase [Furfurilactobacillus rossiae]